MRGRFLLKTPLKMSHPPYVAKRAHELYTVLAAATSDSGSATIIARSKYDRMIPEPAPAINWNITHFAVLVSRTASPST
jgi:hypothetical protein